MGIHRQILRGIDAVRGESCFAVCVSGKYVDDDDHKADGTLVYTGEGGQKKGHQVEDQKKTVGNASLLQSIDTQLPIRVLRGRMHPRETAEYFYDGLYKCTGSSCEASREGPMVYKFMLIPINSESKLRSITVEPTRSPHHCRPRSRPLHKSKRIEIVLLMNTFDLMQRNCPRITLDASSSRVFYISSISIVRVSLKKGRRELHQEGTVHLVASHVALCKLSFISFCTSRTSSCTKHCLPS